ncbi:inner centromere protein A-like isoform X1 [Scylla paramamosain]|uniref:inner centromere protein A-like isoform X1 n=1 Tax=Scylla paramamosain TaxID=85552 RepID=UPI003083596A
MGTMGGMEPLHRLFRRATDMIQETSDSFEQHFLWLEEVVAEARQTLATSELVMLPKTPSAPKRTKRVLKEDAENLPPPASARPSRQGRLCSKLAIEKIQEQTRMSRVKKLRRPSSPINQVLPSTAIKAKTHKNLYFEVSPSPSSPGDDPDKSPASRCERAMSSSPRSSRGNSQQAIKPKRLSTLQKDTSSPKKHSTSLQNDGSTSHEDPVSLLKCDSSSQNDLISSVRKVTFQPKEGTTLPKDSTHQNTEENLIQEVDAGSKSQNTNNATVEPEVHPQDEEEMHLQLDESFEECASADESEEEQDIELVLDSLEGQKSQRGTDEKKEDSALPNILQPSPVSAPVAICSEKEVVEVQDVSPTSGSLPQSHCAPAPRVSRTKQRAMAAQGVSSPSNSCPQSPTVPAPRVTRTKQKVTKVQEIPALSDSPPELPASPVKRVTRTKQRVIETQGMVLPSESVPQLFAPAPRVTRTKQRAMEAQDAVLSQESVLQPPTAPAPRVTRTKQRPIEKEIPSSTPNLPQPAPRVTRTKQKAREMELPVSPQEPTSIKPRAEDEDKIKSQIIQDRGTQQHQPQESHGRGTRVTDVKDSGMFSLGTKRGGWSSAESVSSEESSAPPARITRSKMSKLQQPQLSPAKYPAIENFQRACHSPVGSGRSQSPRKGSPANKRLAGHSNRDGGKDPMAAEVLLSPLRVVRHSPEKTGKVLQARPPVVSGSSGRVTPNVISRMQPFLTSSSSSSTEHRRIVKKIVGTPSEGRRPANIITGVTSFIKTQPARPTREEMESLRLQELQRKKEYEEETLRKKEQLLWAKTEERKRCNEERMRRAKEARLKNEQMAAAAKEQQKLERQQREARQREEEEQQRRLRQQQMAKKKVEEAKKAAKLKEEEERKKQEEEEKRRQKLEEEKRRQKLQEEKRKQKLEEEERKLEDERKNFLAKQKIVLEEQRKLKETKAQMLMKEKEVAERLRLKESLRILRERELQAKREQEAKAVMSSAYMYKNTHSTPLNTTITKESNSGPLNTTYTKPAGSVQTDSYEITPLQPKRSSHSLNNYNIYDIQSDDSTDDDASPRKPIPQWATKTQMRAAMMQQEHYPPKVDEIFPARSLLIIPDLTQIFHQQKRRFRKRTSSANWETPPSKYFRFKSPI